MPVVSVMVHAERAWLRADLRLPPGAETMAVLAFAGAHRLGPCALGVADALLRSGIASLAVDLVTDEEEWADESSFRAGVRFDIAVLAARLLAVIDWVAADPRTRDLRAGCLGAGRAAAAALVAAAARPAEVAVVVSLAGRPELAGAATAAVRAPTLLVVGGLDELLVARNQSVLARLRCRRRLILIPGAGHLVDEPAAVERVAEAVAAWFGSQLAPAAALRA